MATALSKNTKRKARTAINNTGQAAKKGLEKTGGFIAGNPKTALYIGIGIVGAFALYKLLRGVQKGSEIVGDVFNPDIDNSIDVGVIDASTAKISRQQAKVYARQLLDAMNHKAPFWGTDEKTILEIFKRITPGDFKLIFNEFGDKDYNGYNSPPSGILANLDSYEPRNLVYWLNAELSSGDGEVYDRVKQIVNDAGFAF